MKHNRMRKTLALIIAISTLTAFTACGGNDKDKSGNTSSGETQIVHFEDDDDTSSIVKFDDEDEESAATTTTTTATTKKAATTTAAPKRDNTYKVTAKTYESKNGKVKVSYPQISGLYDKSMQNYYNSLFKSDFADYMKEDYKDTFENTYQVTYKSKDLLSIVFRCSSYVDGSAHPYAFAYAYTIDLETGGTLVPSAAIDTGSAAKSFLSGKNWTLTKAVDGVGKSDVLEFYADTGVEQMQEYITETDVVTVTRNKNGKYSISGTVACRSYLDGSAAPIFIMDVPHVIGDYVEIEFNS